MAAKVTKVEVWAADVADRPGGLAQVLESLADAGATIECCIGRRHPDRPGSGVVYVTPVKGQKAQTAARSVGMSPAANIATLRVEGADKPGTGAALSRAIADAGVNLRGISAAVLGGKYVAYFGFDNDSDADRAAKAIKSANVNAGGRGRASGGAARGARRTAARGRARR
jgi:hypothetical protein